MYCTYSRVTSSLCCVCNSASWACCRWAQEMTWRVCWAGEDCVMMMLSCWRYWRNWRELQPRCWTGERQSKRERLVNEWVDDWLSSNSSLCSWMCVSQMECNDLWSAHQTDSSYRKGGGSIRLSLTGNLVIMFHSIAVFTVIYSNKCSIGRTSFKNIINPKPLNSCASCLNHVFEIQITQYADSVATHLTKILESDKHSDVISSAKWV